MRPNHATLLKDEGITLRQHLYDFIASQDFQLLEYQISDNFFIKLLRAIIFSFCMFLKDCDL